MRTISGLALLVLLLSLLTFCKKEDREQQQMQQAQQVQGQAQNGGQISYQVPQGWQQEQPSSRMRQAQFKLPGVGGKEAAELAVFHFPGEGGSVEANLRRWYGQFKTADGQAISEPADRQNFTSNGLQITTVYVTGTYLKSTAPMMMSGPKKELPGYAMMAAIVVHEASPWFFKATGPKETIDHWRADFTSFLKTIRFN